MPTQAGRAGRLRLNRFNPHEVGGRGRLTRGLPTGNVDRRAGGSIERLENCPGCGWESLMKNVTLGNGVTEREPAECLASLSHSTMIGLPRAALEN
ncbi:hypothetical protein EVAR_17140_1 [Eumeta japonica]|uniref:Uncharacterized protein n=1 Tax=Eumeta variegata TaxID=151549 RepID=A0A4C1ULX4_EUMVA|nr:hypothetical protein EVAR_17140_1 [Eumeta japonica]